MNQRGTVSDEISSFCEALKRLPPPMTDFSNGAGCPWCGWLHTTVTYGDNQCEACGRGFQFGHPDWTDDNECWTWVAFPHRQWELLGRRMEVIAKWIPNEIIKALHFQKAEEALGVSAVEGGRQ